MGGHPRAVVAGRDTEVKVHIVYLQPSQVHPADERLRRVRRVFRHTVGKRHTDLGVCQGEGRQGHVARSDIEREVVCVECTDVALESYRTYHVLGVYRGAVQLESAHHQFTVEQRNGLGSDRQFAHVQQGVAVSCGRHPSHRQVEGKLQQHPVHRYPHPGTVTEDAGGEVHRPFLYRRDVEGQKKEDQQDER